MSILVSDTNHHEEWPGLSKGSIDEYVSGKCSFLTVIMPATLVNLDAAIVLDILQQKLGQDTFSQALDWQETIPGPIEERATSSWIKSANMVGVNVRTIGHFWNVVKYALSLSKAQSAIHLLPYWAQHLGERVLIAKQLSERGGVLQCQLLGNRVSIAGNAVTFMEGVLYL